MKQYHEYLADPASAFVIKITGPNYSAPFLTEEAEDAIYEAAKMLACEQEGPNSINYQTLCEFKDQQLTEELCDAFAALEDNDERG